MSLERTAQYNLPVFCVRLILLWGNSQIASVAEQGTKTEN